MSRHEMLCRSGATLAFDSPASGPLTYSWAPEDVDGSRTSAATAGKSSTMHLARESDLAAKASGSTVDVLIERDDDEFVEPLVPVVHVERPRYRIRGPVRVLPRRVPHVSPSLLDLAAEDE